MSKQTLRNTTLAVVVMLMASAASKAFSQNLSTPASHHVLAGDPTGFNPDPTGDGN